MGKEGITLVGGVQKSNLSEGLSGGVADGFSDSAKPDSPALQCSLAQKALQQLKNALKAIDSALAPLAPLLQAMSGMSDQSSPQLTGSASQDQLAKQQALKDLDAAADRAVLAADVYKVYDPKPDGTPARPLPDGFRRISDDPQQLSKFFKGRLSDDQIKDLTQPDNSSYRAAIYQDDKGTTFLVFRGTENKEGLKDWKENGLQGSGMKSEHYEKAKFLADVISDTVGVDKLEIIGHSKGGGMAAAAGIMTGAKTTTFNSAGVHPNTVPGKDLASATQNVKSYVVKGEILNWAQDNRNLMKFGITAGATYGGGPGLGVLTGAAVKDSIPPSVGNRTTLPGAPPSTTLDRVALHGMDRVMQGLDQMRADLKAGN